MLYNGGYGLLMLDQRASGKSQGDTRSLGWKDIPDVKTAVAWLMKRDKRSKIGIYGCSMGASIALAGSVGTSSIQAIAADAPSGLQWFENLPDFTLQDPLSLQIMALYYPLVMLRTQATPPMSTLDAIKKQPGRPMLFISTGQTTEYSRVGVYYQSAAEPKELWNLPESTHCAGPLSDPDEYRQHLLDFFRRSGLP